MESLNLKSKTQNTDQISAESWNNHFRSLNVPDNNNHAEHVEILNKLAEMEKIPTYNNLDNIITDKEITVGINSLKNGNSVGPDGISNEMLKCGKHILLRPLNRLFNSVLSGGTYPEAWAKGHIVPIHKKGGTHDPNNYRGITISSALGKLFNTILNRLTDYLHMNNITLYVRTK